MEHAPTIIRAQGIPKLFHQQKSNFVQNFTFESIPESRYPRQPIKSNHLPNLNMQRAFRAMI